MGGGNAQSTHLRSKCALYIAPRTPTNARLEDQKKSAICCSSVPLSSASCCLPFARCFSKPLTAAFRCSPALLPTAFPLPPIYYSPRFCCRPHSAASTFSHLGQGGSTTSSRSRKKPPSIDELAARFAAQMPGGIDRAPATFRRALLLREFSKSDWPGSCLSHQHRLARPPSSLLLFA